MQLASVKSREQQQRHGEKATLTNTKHDDLDNRTARRAMRN